MCRGPGVALFCPDLLDSTLRGGEAMGDFAIDYTITWALEEESVSVVVYNVGDGDLRFAEIISWDGENVRQAHVYTLSASPTRS